MVARPNKEVFREKVNRDRRIASGEKATLNAVVAVVDAQTGIGWIGYERLAANTGRSVRTVKRHVKTMTELDPAPLVIVQRGGYRNGRGYANRYQAIYGYSVPSPERVPDHSDNTRSEGSQSATGVTPQSAIPDTGQSANLDTRLDPKDLDTEVRSDNQGATPHGVGTRRSETTTAVEPTGTSDGRERAVTRPNGRHDQVSDSAAVTQAEPRSAGAPLASVFPSVATPSAAVDGNAGSPFKPARANARRWLTFKPGHVKADQIKRIERCRTADDLLDLLRSDRDFAYQREDSVWLTDDRQELERVWRDRMQYIVSTQSEGLPVP